MFRNLLAGAIGIQGLSLAETIDLARKTWFSLLVNHFRKSTASLFLGEFSEMTKEEPAPPIMTTG